jgi:hypothetical protein
MWTRRERPVVASLRMLVNMRKEGKEEVKRRVQGDGSKQMLIESWKR